MVVAFVLVLVLVAWIAVAISGSMALARTIRRADAEELVVHGPGLTSPAAGSIAATSRS